MELGIKDSGKETSGMVSALRFGLMVQNEGYWKNNKAHGRGVFWHVYGDKYEGEWKRDKAHGVGKYTHSNGATYEGDWRNDLQHG